MTIRFSVLIVFVLIFTALHSGAEEKPDAKVDFVPGIYKMSIVRDDFDGNEPQEYDYERCVPFERYQPFSGNYQSENCEVLNFKRKDNDVSYDIYCSHGLKKGMIATLSYGYKNETLWWKSYSVGNEGEEVYSFKVQGKAVRLGDCEDTEPVKPF